MRNKQFTTSLLSKIQISLNDSTNVEEELIDFLPPRKSIPAPLSLAESALEEEVSSLVRDLTAAHSSVHFHHPMTKAGADKLKLLMAEFREQRCEWSKIFKGQQWISLDLSSNYPVITFEDEGSDLKSLASILESISVSSNQVCSFNLHHLQTHTLIGLSLVANKKQKISSSRNASL